MLGNTSLSDSVNIICINEDYIKFNRIVQFISTWFIQLFLRLNILNLIGLCKLIEHCRIVVCDHHYSSINPYCPPQVKVWCPTVHLGWDAKDSSSITLWEQALLPSIALWQRSVLLRLIPLLLPKLSACWDVVSRQVMVLLWKQLMFNLVRIYFTFETSDFIAIWLLRVCFSS